ncbi:MFS transporter [Streptomyces sp. CB01881]|uniref:MFS transporter n=1 Tax=Streptomyces sp. CB01881 TaxID=2078691 RepID=UPI000CDC71AF|nr:MFS transporter [Streptomyces sp. CB01881]AUY48010.1 MFS transporter [Streptomyces sp. CB01881]TYC76490.1 MFS transporter [Streptomyces sp. CB01881]
MPRTDRSGTVLLAACLGLFTVFMQTTQTIGTLGAVRAGLGLDAADLVWIPSMYTLVVASVVLGAGAFADRWGRRRIFLIGTLAMGAGGLVLVSADSLAAVLAGQAVAGLGGALITPSSLALVTHAFPDPRRRAGAISAWAAASGLGLALGPVTAGLALRWSTWHAAFWLGPAIAALAAAAALLGVPESRVEGGRLDWPGQFLATAGLALLIYWLIDGGHHGYLAGRPLAAAVTAAVLLAGFTVVELRRDHPLLDLRLMRSPSYSAALLLAATVLFGFVGLSLLQVLWLQQVRGLTALQVGVQLLAEFGTFIVASALAGVLGRRVGAAPLIFTGLLLAAAGAVLFAGVGAADAFGGYAPALVVFGLGCGLANAPSTALAVGQVPRGKEGVAAGTVNAARQVGAVLGTSILGTLMTTRFESGLGRLPRPEPLDVARAFTDAVGHAATVCAVVLLAGTVAGAALSALTRRNRPAPPAPAPARPETVSARS